MSHIFCVTKMKVRSKLLVPDGLKCVPEGFLKSLTGNVMEMFITQLITVIIENRSNIVQYLLALKSCFNRKIVLNNCFLF